MAEIRVEGLNEGGTMVYFWYGDFDGDAFIDGDQVTDPVLNDSGVQFASKEEVLATLQDWYDQFISGELS
jgi:hypothetical protein